ncbi:MAG: cation:proton antiporter [Deinococcota bacterium]
MALEQIIFLTGVIIVIALLVKAGLEHIGVPSLVGYLLLGLVLRSTGIVPEEHEMLTVLGEIGVIMLLFRVGLTANLAGLLKQLKRASIIWFWTVLFSGTLGFITCVVLGFNSLASSFVAVALTATSVGVALGVWLEAGVLHTASGELLLDVAELDDISAVLLMALLVSLAPTLQQTDSFGWQQLGVIAQTTGALAIRGTIFALFCYIFSRYFERPITRLCDELERGPDPMITMAGIGLMIAAVAAALGFSVAIGAFFAGLVYSRDPRAVKKERAFNVLYEFFVPFFFIGLGFLLEPQSLGKGIRVGLVLLIVAVAGKMLGTLVPFMREQFKAQRGIKRWRISRSGVILGLSMVPRAEIALIVMQQGLSLGIVSSGLFAGIVVVSAVTCVAAPMVLKPLLNNYSQRSLFALPRPR